MLLWFTIAAVAIIAIFFIVVAMQPPEFVVTRSALISAPPPKVFSQVNDFHNWEKWSPWAKLDPNATNSFEGSPAGSGAIFRWSGNKKVGQGAMTITDSKPPELIRIKLEFLKPFKCTNTAAFTFEPQGEQTSVTWTMRGNKIFISKLFGMIMNMDKMVGGDFEKGLAAMKSVCESSTGN